MVSELKFRRASQRIRVRLSSNGSGSRFTYMIAGAPTRVSRFNVHKTGTKVAFWILPIFLTVDTGRIQIWIYTTYFLKSIKGLRKHHLISQPHFASTIQSKIEPEPALFFQKWSRRQHYLLYSQKWSRSQHYLVKNGAGASTILSKMEPEPALFCQKWSRSQHYFVKKGAGDNTILSKMEPALICQ